MPTEQSADCRQRTIGKVKNLAGTVFINRTFASTECKEYYCLPATQRSAGCLLTCNEVDSANANAWQSGRVQKDGQESSVSLTFCHWVGRQAGRIHCTRRTRSSVNVERRALGRGRSAFLTSRTRINRGLSDRKKMCDGFS